MSSARSFKSNSFLIVPLIVFFFFCIPLPLTIEIFHLIYSSFWGKILPSFPLMSVIHTFSQMHSFLILSCLVCPLIECSILISALSFMLWFYRPTFSTIKHRRSYSCAVKCSFKLERDFSITNNTQRMAPFHPPA